MLISAITFEIRDFNTGEISEFLIENTVDNQEKIFAHRFTRNIHFTQMFDFEFARKLRYPAEFIDFSTEFENEIDPVDEMVGMIL